MFGCVRDLYLKSAYPQGVVPENRKLEEPEPDPISHIEAPRHGEEIERMTKFLPPVGCYIALDRMGSIASLCPMTFYCKAKTPTYRFMLRASFGQGQSKPSRTFLENTPSR